MGIFGAVTFSKLMPRIFKYGNILNISFTPDKEINILIYRSPSYLIIIIQESYTLKNGPILGPRCIIPGKYIKQKNQHFNLICMTVMHCYVKDNITF